MYPKDELPDAKQLDKIYQKFEDELKAQYAGLEKRLNWKYLKDLKEEKDNNIAYYHILYTLIEAGILSTDKKNTFGLYDGKECLNPEYINAAGKTKRLYFTDPDNAKKFRDQVYGKKAPYFIIKGKAF